MRNVLKALLAASLIAGCSSTPEATEAETTATAFASATATAAEPPPETTAVASTTTTAAPTPPPPEPAADFVVTPAKIVVDPKTTVEIKADKGLYLGAKKIATFDKNTLKLEGMDHWIAVYKDGTIEMKPSSSKKMKFNEKDEIEIEGGGKVALDDKGKLTMVPATDKAPPKDFKLPVVTGFKVDSRRATTIAVFFVLFTTTATKEPAPPASSGGPGASATAKASAAPATTGTAPKK